jgi:benzodiazapine receptor
VSVPRFGWPEFAAALVSLAAVTAVALFGAQFMPGAWYAALVKPEWNPPNWVFGPVWTTLYLMMALAAWRVWRVAGIRPARTAFLLYFTQLVFNALWSMLFFGWQRPDLAFAWIVVLLALILATALAFRRHDRVAGWLFAPYALWVSFAAFLNFTLWRLNA